jgi:hypothetical protein
MTVSLFKPTEDTPEEVTLEFKKDALSLFSLPDEKINSIFDALELSKGINFTDSDLAKVLEVNISTAATMYSIFLFIVHHYAKHIELDQIRSDLISAGCDSKKVEIFTTRLNRLDEYTKRVAAILPFTGSYVEDDPTIKSVGYGIEYRMMRREGDEKDAALLPVLALELTIEQDGRKDKSFRVYFPINEFGHFSKSLEEIGDSASEEIRKFKKDMANNLPILGG